ncbi:hypothetical protein NJ76_31920 [Rhodococcus sp. IITR03]|nr:hypothetical protein NJ76_31920 [Rhodococcus sp. IITR03]
MSAPRPIRTLLIDNYDSFTYNLYDLITRVNGLPPRVLTNDRSWDELVAEPFDNIVISPRTGRPDRARDFGISARASPTPGYRCSGCAWAIRTVPTVRQRRDPAPEPVHGRTSRSCTTAPACSPGCRRRSRRCATTR